MSRRIPFHLISPIALSVALAACSSSGDGAASTDQGELPLDPGPAGQEGASADDSGGSSADEGAAGDGSADDGSADDGAMSDGAADGAEEGLDPDAIVNVDVPDEPPGGDADAPGEPAVPTSGCGVAAGASSGERSLMVDGVMRTYLIDVPAAYDEDVPTPLVFGFHGATTSGEFFRNPFYGNLLSTMGEQAIVVHGNALGDPTAWDNQADVPYFDAVLDDVSSTLCVDETRVFATGHSSGGFFTNTLGCQRGDVLRAIAPVSGGGPFTFGGNNGCVGEVAVWIAHGENDETVDFQLGLDSRDRWLEANGCDADAPTTALEIAGCEEYSGCRAGLGVRFCVHQDGHNWPDFAPEGIWDFFSSL